MCKKNKSCFVVFYKFLFLSRINPIQFYISQSSSFPNFIYFCLTLTTSGLAGAATQALPRGGCPTGEQRIAWEIQKNNRNCCRAGNVTAPVILAKATPRQRPQMELWTQALDMRGKLENDYLSNIWPSASGTLDSSKISRRSSKEREFTNWTHYRHIDISWFT